MKRKVSSIVINSLLVVVFLLSFFGGPDAFARTPTTVKAESVQHQESEPTQPSPLPVDGSSPSDDNQAADDQDFIPPEPLEANDTNRAVIGTPESDALPDTAVVEAHEVSTTYI